MNRSYTLYCFVSARRPAERCRPDSRMGGVGSRWGGRRVITDNKTGVPQIKIDGHASAMSARVDNPSAAFPVHVCEHRLRRPLRRRL